MLIARLEVCSAQLSSVIIFDFVPALRDKINALHSEQQAQKRKNVELNDTLHDKVRQFNKLQVFKSQTFPIILTNTRDCMTK